MVQGMRGTPGIRPGRSALVWGFVLLAGAAARGADAPTPVPTYDRDVRPLFEARCVKCHGAKAPKAELDLTTHAGLLKGGESGPAVVPGKPAESPLYEAVHEGRMPSGKTGRLEPGQVEMLRRWIEAGASPGAGGSPEPAASTSATITQHDVYPIVLRRCTACHGRTVREGGLDLRTRASMLAGGKSGPAFVPNHPEQSRMIERIRKEEMPPRRRVIDASVKPMEPAELEVLERWIRQGAPEVKVEPDVATREPDPLVTDEDRSFWAFQPPKEVRPPAVRDAGRVRNPMDAFILEKLETKGLTLAPEADRPTLIRRLTFDLTGLPPTPEEVDTFVNDDRPDAYERLVDRLLASPRYGERWGRHWLDVAGYADSEGKREQDIPRPSAWRYRDYVIRSFNADKPYDRFLTEQLAGDDLADYEHAKEITPELEDNLVATGFLRMAPDPTWAHLTNFVVDRLDVLADEMDVLGSGVMGLTLKCARCHSHKYDPIPQRDYYRLLAVFKGAFDEHDWLRSGWDGTISKGTRNDRELTQVTTSERKRWEESDAKAKAEIKALEEQLSREDGKSARHDELSKAVAEAKKRVTPPPTIRALWDRGEPSPTYIYKRGDDQNPGRLVGPGVPSVLTDGKTPFEPKPPRPGAASTGRRPEFARWLTRPDHPLTARVMVNRVWKHHFGQGIVPTAGNFGKAGAPPTHPELLDWLARAFVRQGWSVKALHRLIVQSTTYRQSSRVTEASARLDPDGSLYSRRPLARLEAEALHDALLSVSGRLDTRPFGPADPITARPDGLVTPVGGRRALYNRQERKQVSTLLEVFDLPPMNPNCLERRASTVATQALHLWNDARVRDLSTRFAARVAAEAGDDPARQVDRAFRLALGRPPDGPEREAAVGTLSRLRSADPKQAAGALAAVCHALLNSAAFLYID
ncbi:MAG: PSD1 and planctomycete cytochrome C domain-containing protein [Isosphaeraceae bacterium]